MDDRWIVVIDEEHPSVHGPFDSEAKAKLVFDNFQDDEAIVLYIAKVISQVGEMDSRVYNHEGEHCYDCFQALHPQTVS